LNHKNTEGHGKTITLEISPLERIEITNIKLVLLSESKLQTSN